MSLTLAYVVEMPKRTNGRPTRLPRAGDGRPYLTAVRRAGTHIVGATVLGRQSPYKSLKLMTVPSG